MQIWKENKLCIVWKKRKRKLNMAIDKLKYDENKLKKVKITRIREATTIKQSIQKWN